MTKILPCRFKQCFGAFNMLTAHKCSDTGSFRHLSKPAFKRPITSEAHLFFQKIQNFMYISELQQKTEKIFSDF